MPVPSMAAAAIKTPGQVWAAATPNEPPVVGKKRQEGEREPRGTVRGDMAGQSLEPPEQQTHGRCGLTAP